MATYAAYRHIELDNIGYGKKRVLKPPGGGTSDIFGAVEPQEPRIGRAQPQQQSSFFTSHDETTPIKTKSGNDKEPNANLLDETLTRFSSASKNKDKYKSNIVFGNDENVASSAKKTITSTSSHGETSKTTSIQLAGAVRNDSHQEKDGNAVIGNGTHKSVVRDPEPESQQPENRPSRPRVPPGGFSQGLW